MMFLNGLSVAAALLLQTVLGAVSVSLTTSNAGTSNISNPIIPKTYIVQLKTDPSLLKRSAATAHAAFQQAAKDLKYSTRQIYNDETIFSGLSLTLESDDDLPVLAAIDNVVGIWPVTLVKRPSAVTKQIPHLKKIRRQFPGDATTPSIPHITGDIDVNRPHVMSGVDKLHAAGIKGKGIKIAAIDTGVDFRHPSLGGCFGPGCKISFGFDMTADPLDPGSEIPEAIRVAGGHGSHVMGKSIPVILFLR
jgi:subtilisin family serine protease